MGYVAVATMSRRFVTQDDLHSSFGLTEIEFTMLI